ncbi:MAG TPA: transposase, partial [Geminicoccaceae bacterium]|nr:transposase [Geminicoccaceae bacterium]
DEEQWAFIAPRPALLREDAGQRRHGLREAFDGSRHVVKTGAPWRRLPRDLPPWEIVRQRAQRWLQAGVFEAAVHDPRALSRGLAGRAGRPPTVVLDGRTPPSPPATVEGPPLVALATLMGHEAVALLAQVPNIL